MNSVYECIMASEDNTFEKALQKGVTYYLNNLE